MTTEPTPANSATPDVAEKPASTGITNLPMAPAPMPSTVPAPEPAPTPGLSAAPQPTPPWVLKVDYLLLALVLAFSFFVASFTATNSDIWMHLAIGQRLSDGTLQFGVDPFSWATEAVGGKPATLWVHQSWLYSWLFYHLFNLVGGAGVVLGKAILFTAAIALLSRIGWNEANRWFVLICLAMAALAISPRLLLQPTVVSFLFLAITLFILDKAGAFVLVNAETMPVCCTRGLWVLPPLFALWANLDAWFILGPLTLGLCWAAAGLRRWFKNSGTIPAKMLGMVFGVGLLACLLNPFHVRVFQMPPELAYMVISLTDALKIPLPDTLVAGGRTLKELRRLRVEPASFAVISPLTNEYLRDTRFGWNIAGLAFYPLALLGLLGFTLTALVKPHANAPSLQVGRFLLWLVFGVMALSLYRMIPFFALVAAPLTAMTLGEFLRWQQISNATTAAKRDRGLHLARLVSIPFLLLLLYLAWPGWLHGNNDFNSARRVAWQVRADASMQRAAETLQALKKSGECKNVFNVSVDFAHYCANFAPDVKCFMDTRFALFADQVPAFTKARTALINSQREESDFLTLFEERNIDQIVLTNFTQLDKHQRWWLLEAEWRWRGGDNRHMVFSWAGPKERWPTNTASDDLNRQAFGVIPSDRRPPQHGATSEPAPTFWSLYKDGFGPQPVGVAEYRVLKDRFELEAKRSFLQAQNYTFLSFAMPTPSLPGGGATLPATVAGLLHQLRPADKAPPALPILMVRTARQAVFDNPLDMQSRLQLIEAVQTLRRAQEDFWIHPFVAGNLRERLREIQLVNGMYNLVQLPPRHPNDTYQHNLQMAEIYKHQDMIDLALDHLQMAEQGLEAWRASGRDLPKDPKEMDAFLKQFHDQVEHLEMNVRKRNARWKEISEGKPAVQQAQLALHAPYRELIGAQAGRPAPLGLGKKAMEILQAIPAGGLKAEEELAYLHLNLELLLRKGQVDVIAAELTKEDRRKALGPLVLGQYQTIVGGVLGDYEMMEEGTAGIEKYFRQAIETHRQKVLPALLIAPSLQSASTMIAPIAMQAIPRFIEQHGMHNELFNAMTLRGIGALEAGDTAKARTIFEATLREAGEDYFFTERPIARRYLSFLNQQRQR